jgi:hypothetical protein
MDTQRRIGTSPQVGGGIELPLAILALVVAAVIAALVIVNVSARGPIHEASVRPRVTVPAAMDDRPPHLVDLPPARGNLVAPAPTMRVDGWEPFPPSS